MFFRDSTCNLSKRVLQLPSSYHMKAPETCLGKKKRTRVAKTNWMVIWVPLIFRLGLVWRYAYYSMSLYIENLNSQDVCRSFRALEQFWFQTLFRALGKKESLIVLILGDWNGFVCQCFSINEDYLARSLLTFVCIRTPRKQKSAH